MVMVRPQIAIGIVAHPTRLESVGWLTDQVAPDVVQVDYDQIGCGRNHLMTIERTHAQAVTVGADWLVIMEDDALPVENFRIHAQQCLSHSPSKIVSFYLGTGYPQQYQALFAAAVLNSSCWITHKWMRHAVCYAIHRTIALPLLEQMRNLVGKRWAPDDAIGEYARQHNLPISYTNPSLADHADTTSVVTNRTHRGHPTSGRSKVRKAHRYGVPSDWNDQHISV